MPVELDHALALAAADQHVEALHRHVKVQRLNPFDGDAKGVVVTQIIEFGTVFALDRLDPQGFAPPIGLRPISLRTGQRRKPLERRTAQVVVIGMDPVAIALEPPAHGAQKRLDAVAHLPIE